MNACVDDACLTMRRSGHWDNLHFDRNQSGLRLDFKLAYRNEFLSYEHNFFVQVKFDDKLNFTKKFLTARARIDAW